MKTSELTGVMLDYWVARAEGVEVVLWSNEEPVEKSVVVRPFKRGQYPAHYQPSTDWAQGGPIIEREVIELLYFKDRIEDGGPWEAQVGGGTRYIDQYAGDAMGGPTPLVAAMRAHVENKFGDEVPETTQ